MLAAAISLRHAPGVEAAVRLLNDNTSSNDKEGMAVRMAHVPALLEEAAAAAAEAAAQDKDTGDPRKRLRATRAAAHARSLEREAWALLEAMLHG
jgi:hypothetical protein